MGSMTSRRLLVLALLCVTAVVTAACGRGDGKPATIKVVIAEYSRDHTRPFWQSLAEQYTKQTGVKVDLQVIDWNSIDQQVSTMIQNNQPPDVLNLNSFSSYAKDGLLYSADEALSAKTRDDFLEAFARGGTYRDKLYGFPILASARAFFYNRDLLERAKVSRAAAHLGRAGPGRAEGAGARRRGDRLRAAARPRGGAGGVVDLDVEQRGRLEIGRRLDDQQRQERRRRSSSWPGSPTPTR